MTKLYIALLWAVILAAIWAIPAGGHEAPTGWAYDPACCSDRACRPLTLLEVNSLRRGEGGYLATMEGFAEPILFPESKILPSRDQYFHGCVGASGAGYCLYVPSLSENRIFQNRAIAVNSH